nr:MAG: wsv427-like protein [Penaeus monodon endogenous nimavirus]
MSTVNKQLVKEALSRLVDISRGIQFIRNRIGQVDECDITDQQEYHQQQQQQHVPIDFAITNDPNASQMENVRRLKVALDCWEKSFKNVKQGERDTFLRAISWMVAYVILDIGNHEIPDSYISPKKDLNQQVKAILLECISSSSSSDLSDLSEHMEADDPRFITSCNDPSTETEVCMAQHLFKIWTSNGSRKQYSSRVIRCLANGQPQRFLAVWDFLIFLKDAVELYLCYPVHRDRDWRLACIGELQNKTFCETLCYCKASSHDSWMPPTLLRYSADTSEAIITSDYLLKATVELILSPHIHWEWKSGLIQFLAEKGAKMLKRFCKTSSTSACEENSEEHDTCDNTGHIANYNPLTIVPCAANLWDFCRTERPPSDVQFIVLNAEAPSDPMLTSGAGPWCMADLPRLRKLQQQEVELCTSCHDALETYDCILVHRLSIAARVGNNACRLSTIKWRHHGGILMTNAAPVNAAFADPGSSLIKHPNGPPINFFISTLVRLIITSKHNLGNEDRDMAGVLNTISFGCTDLLKSLPCRSRLSVLMTTSEDLLSKELSDRQLRSSTVISSRLPRLF